MLNVSNVSRFLSKLSRTIVRAIAVKRGPRSLLNQAYSLLSETGKARFHARYAKVFRERNVALEPGEWSVRFLDRRIRLPLRSSWSWLDWDHAVSILGQDNEIKQTYAALIASDNRPTVFLDVGANYGIHSILFLSAGIPVIAFEPNPSCFPHFQTICKLNAIRKLNGLAVRWEQAAIGNETGLTELVYPEKDTWLGSVASDVQSVMRKWGGVITLQVPLKKLDDYLTDIPCGEVVMKIDVEGYETKVLAGATLLLKDRAPKVIFESNDPKKRPELFRLFGGAGYAIHPLPWRPAGGSRPLSVDEFVAAAATNFIAIAASPA
jgi:FkbM family methyltransferase